MTERELRTAGWFAIVFLACGLYCLAMAAWFSEGPAVTLVNVFALIFFGLAGAWGWLWWTHRRPD